LKTARVELSAGEAVPLRSVKVSVKIRHTYPGDLVVDLVPPPSVGGRINLRNRSGRSEDNIEQTYDVTTTPQLAALDRKIPSGTWALEVMDTTRTDEGRIEQFSVEYDI
jgi:subtilisin-like proprotein convertase family protein